MPFCPYKEMGGGAYVLCGRGQSNPAPLPIYGGISIVESGGVVKLRPLCPYMEVSWQGGWGLIMLWAWLCSNSSSLAIYGETVMGGEAYLRCGRGQTVTPPL